MKLVRKEKTSFEKAGIAILTVVLLLGVLVIANVSAETSASQNQGSTTTLPTTPIEVQSKVVSAKLTLKDRTENSLTYNLEIQDLHGRFYCIQGENIDSNRTDINNCFDINKHSFHLVFESEDNLEGVFSQKDINIESGEKTEITLTVNYPGTEREYSFSVKVNPGRSDEEGVIINETFNLGSLGEAKTCRVGCICEGEGTIKCPTEQEPVETEVSTGTGQGETSISVTIGKTESGSFSIKSGEVEATTKGNVKGIGGKLYYESSGGEKEIKIMPGNVISIAGAVNIEKVELVEEDSKLIYVIRENKDTKILLLFSAKGNVETKISAENGEIISVKKPWWSFLASGI
jgi:hypothetical protein